MRKYFILTGVILSVLVFTNCNESKKLAAKPAPKSTYTADLSVVIMNNCVPCHIPARGGRKKAYDNYANVKTDIDEMIRRIELNPTDKGFMPFKKTEKLPDSTIAKFKKWRDDGLLEN
jgi:mono/diheme cytochrome c family protein